jgi:hypothetical protein
MNTSELNQFIDVTVYFVCISGGEYDDYNQSHFYGFSPISQDELNQQRDKAKQEADAWFNSLSPRYELGGSRIDPENPEDYIHNGRYEWWRLMTLWLAERGFVSVTEKSCPDIHEPY